MSGYGDNQKRRSMCAFSVLTQFSVRAKELRKHDIELAFKIMNKTINKLNATNNIVNKGKKSGV